MPSVEAGLSLKDVDLSNVDWETDLSDPLKSLLDQGKS